MTATSREPLPLEAEPVRGHDGGWSVRLAVRAEDVTISKQTVLKERARLERKQVQHVAQVDAVLLREQLRTTKSAAVELHERATENASHSPAAKDISAK